MSVLGERLRAERKLRGWTLEQAGEVFGLPKSTLANYETGAAAHMRERQKRLRERASDGQHAVANVDLNHRLRLPWPGR